MIFTMLNRINSVHTLKANTRIFVLSFFSDLAHGVLWSVELVDCNWTIQNIENLHPILLNQLWLKLQRWLKKCGIAFVSKNVLRLLKAALFSTREIPICIHIFHWNDAICSIVPSINLKDFSDWTHHEYHALWWKIDGRGHGVSRYGFVPTNTRLYVALYDMIWNHWKTSDDNPFLLHRSWSRPVFCLLLGVSSDYVQAITGWVDKLCLGLSAHVDAASGQLHYNW